MSIKIEQLSGDINTNGHVTRTAEFVSPGHPDKICDQIADTLLDKYLEQDPHSRVALEVTGGHGQIFITGEVTSTANVNVEAIVAEFLERDDYTIIVNLDTQSSEIAAGVDDGGAGDQGIVIGYACNETLDLLPLEYVLARDLCQALYKIWPVDGKVQVTINKMRPVVIVASWQGVSTIELESAVRKFIPEADNYLINPAGDWQLGGFDADAGTTNRKLAIDHYGPRVRLGGGGLSGKDLTKTDRSGAYVARHLAVQALAQTDANWVEVELAFAIGIPGTVATNVICNGGNKHFEIPSNISPVKYLRDLKVDQVQFANTAAWGHFGRNLPWDKASK